MGSSSVSEGEVIESDSEKATTAQAFLNDKFVDRQSRSPGVIAPRASYDRSLERSRSRSPYRHNRRRSPRGEKRRRNDEVYDDYNRGSRRFRSQYDRRSLYEDDDRSKSSYADPDRSNPSYPSLSYSDRDGDERRWPSRARTRSRSPNHHYRRSERRGYEDSSAKGRERDSRRHELRLRDRDDRLCDEDRRKDRRDGHNENRGEYSDARSMRIDAETRHGAPIQNSKNSTKNANDHRLSPQNDTTNGDQAVEPEPEPVDEVKLIEERRKRREAIKAKYNEQRTPLLVEALQLRSGINSENTGTQPEKKLDETECPTPLSTNNSSVTSPQRTCMPASPDAVIVDNDSDLANHVTLGNEDVDAEEPSAADYDPTMDMREDKARDNQRHQAGPTIAERDTLELDSRRARRREEALVNQRAYRPRQKAAEEALEDKNKNHNITLSEPDNIGSANLQVPGNLLSIVSSEPENISDQLPSPETRVKETKDTTIPAGDFDMFADEDDMFAEDPPKSEPKLTKSVSTQHAKRLDASLLDDWDDPDGYYRIILGELLDGRYHVQENLGRGMFSGVARATDVTKKSLVAIKIIRNNETMRKAGMKEISILKKLCAIDPDDKHHLIRLERSFDHKGHLCMVFENLSINLREVLKKFGRDVGINIRAVRSYAQQMFMGLRLLRNTNILHADLKPDNMLVNDSRNVLKICDLGSAAEASENEITPYLVSRFYRAPEIILGAPYDFAIDTWSIGCTLYELYTGKILFTGRTNNQMLRAMMECRGKFSLKLLKKAEFGAAHFDENLNFKSFEKDKITGRDVVRLINFVKPTRDLRSRLLGTTKGLGDVETRELNLFIDLLDRCLNLNPEKRITPKDALKHPFILRPKS